MREIQAELEKILAPEIRRHVVEVKARRDGLVVSLREIGFYESGSSTLRPSARDAVDRLASILKSHPESLRIEGHTDNVPIHNVHFASNWELSTARASDLVKELIDRYHFEPQRLSAAGYAEFHPVAPNNTEEGRAQNRRVDIVILNPPMVETAPPSSPSANATGNSPGNSQADLPPPSSPPKSQ
jgi:chemotaxis protein MotB